MLVTGGIQTDVDGIMSVAAAVGEVDGIIFVTAGEGACDGSNMN